MGIFRVSLISSFVLTFLFMSGCSKQTDDVSEKKIDPKPVRTQTIATGAQIIKSFPGVIDAAQTAELGFRVNGELSEIKVREGELVKQGQILAQLDQTDFVLAVKSADADFQRVKSDFSRAQKLIEKGAISRADFDSLKAQMRSAEVQLETAQQNLKYTTLKAPFDGVVARTYVENFEKISSSEKFAAIQDLSSLEVGIDVPESIMIQIRREESRHDVKAVFEDLGGRSFPLTFKEASTRSDENTQTYRVTFMMPAPQDANILPGMSTLVVATEKREENAGDDIYVPAHAVLEDASGRFVYTVEDIENDDQGTVRRRAVVVGKLSEHGIQIVQGLLVGDQVITAGMSKISEGMTVRLMSSGAAL